MHNATNPIDFTSELRQIADTIERNGGWHIAAVKVRAAADRLDELEPKPKAAPNIRAEGIKPPFVVSTRARELKATATKVLRDPIDHNVPAAQRDMAVTCFELLSLIEQASSPNLGLATMRQLLDEIRARIEVDGNLDYKTVGEQ